MLLLPRRSPMALQEEEDLGERFGDLGVLQDFYRGSSVAVAASASSGSTGGASLLSLGAIAEEASDLAAITGEVADGASSRFSACSVVRVLQQHRSAQCTMRPAACCAARAVYELRGKVRGALTSSRAPSRQPPCGARAQMSTRLSRRCCCATCRCGRVGGGGVVWWLALVCARTHTPRVLVACVAMSMGLWRA